MNPIPVVIFINIMHWGMGMDGPSSLIAAIVEEDRLLQELLHQCPESDREIRSPGGTLSLKETLGHLAFWDSFAVRFFEDKLDPRSEKPSPILDFEAQSRRELERFRKLPFNDVLHRYRDATAGLIAFLRHRWHELSDKEHRDFQVPLKHRRHHRLLLTKALKAPGQGDERAHAGEA